MVPPYAVTVTGSSRLAEARPVLNPPNSLRSTSIAPSMRRRRSVSNESSSMAFLPCCYLIRLPDDRISPTPAQNLGKPAAFEQGKHQDRYTTLTCQRNRRRIHHLQVTRQNIEIAEPVEPYRTRHSVGVGIIHAIDFGRLQKRIASHLGSPECRGSVRREKWIPGPGREDHHSPFFEMAQRSAANIRFADRLHRDGGLDAGRHSALFECVLHCDGINHRRQHAHIVARGALHPDRTARYATEDVAAADHQAQLDAERVYRCDLVRYAREHSRVKAIFPRAHQRPTGDLQPNPAVPEIG